MYKSATIKNHSIFICGPEALRESHIKQLLQKGVSIKDIHYEEFSFR
jgi:predicted ferric reductase